MINRIRYSFKLTSYADDNFINHNYCEYKIIANKNTLKVNNIIRLAHGVSESCYGLSGFKVKRNFITIAEKNFFKKRVYNDSKSK